MTELINEDSLLKKYEKDADKYHKEHSGTCYQVGDIIETIASNSEFINMPLFYSCAFIKY